MSILGIDGGGTRTRLELRTDSNQLICRENLGPFNMASIGEAAFRQRIGEIFAFCGDMSQLKSICVGGAGTSGSGMEAVLREELKKTTFNGVLTLRGDHEIALAGALDGPGIVLIAGTGSICCGRNETGRLIRCGGWGHIIDDGGSAYAIGRAALSAAVRTEDGRLPPSQLHRAVMEHLGAQNARDIVNFVYYRNSTKAEIAALAPVCMEAAESGDAAARHILNRQAMELRELAESTARQLEMRMPPLVLLGGLLEQDCIYSRMVRQALADDFCMVLPAHDALWGAAQLAWEAHKGNC